MENDLLKKLVGDLTENNRVAYWYGYVAGRKEALLADSWVDPVDNVRYVDFRKKRLKYEDAKAALMVELDSMRAQNKLKIDIGVDL